MAYGRPIAVRAGMGRPTRRRPSDAFGTPSPVFTSLPLSVAASVARLASASLSAQINTTAGSEDPATYRYVKPTATGTGSGADWTNAAGWNTLTPARGLIYYMAGSATRYADKTITTAPSGTTPIIFRKASVVDHGTSTGWSDTFGTTQCQFGGLNLATNYVTWDGRYKYGFRHEGHWTDVGRTTATNGYITVTTNAVGLVVTNIEFDGVSAIEWREGMTGSANCVISNCWWHDMNSPGDAPCVVMFGTNHIVENNEVGPTADIDFMRCWGSSHIIRGNYIHDITLTGSAHSDILQVFGDRGYSCRDIIFENNICLNSQGQVCNLTQDLVMLPDGTDGIGNIIFRNNVFAYFDQNINVSCPDVQFYNNTFYRTGVFYQARHSTNPVFNGTRMVVKNNMIVGLSGDSNDYDYYYNNPDGLPTTKQNNFYATTSGAALVGYAAESGGVNGGTPGFVNAGTLASHASSALDFRLMASSAAINKGQTLSGFSSDLLGVSRPQGAAWDCGPYEYTP